MSYDGDLGRPRAFGSSEAPLKPLEDELKRGRFVPHCSPVDSVSPDGDGSRPGDNMIDRPKAIASEVGSPSPSADHSDASSDVSLDNLVTRRKFAPPGFLKSPRWTLTVTFIIAVILLVVFSHAIRFLRDAMTLPLPLKWPSLLLLALCVGVIGYTLVRAVRFFIRLSRGPQLGFAQLKSVGAFAGNKPYRIAKEEVLMPFLRSFLNRNPDVQEQFRKLKGSDAIMTAAKRLLDSDRNISSRDWIDEFMDRIQKPMDGMAQEQINWAAKAVAIKTAISPWPFVDVASVLHNSVNMITNLSVIYNRRLGKGGVIRVLVDLFFSTYIAGQAQDAVDAIEENFGKGVPLDLADSKPASETLFGSIFDNLGPATAGLARASGKKFAEGATNWLLMRRMGRRAADLFKPVME